MRTKILRRLSKKPNGPLEVFFEIEKISVFIESCEQRNAEWGGSLE